MLAGNVAALLSPIIFIPILTYALGPQNYDWKSMMDIRKGDDHDLAAAAGVDLENTSDDNDERATAAAEEQRKLLRAGKISKTTTIIMVSQISQTISTNANIYLDHCLPCPLASSHVRYRLHLFQALFHWLGHCWNYLDFLLLHRRRPVPRLRGPQDSRANCEVHLS